MRRRRRWDCQCFQGRWKLSDEVLNALHAAVTPDSSALVDTTPYGPTVGPNDVAPIPREDLSFGIPDWHGTGGGTRSQRNGDNVINWTSPL